jgi:hypothetical protein
MRTRRRHWPTWRMPRFFVSDAAHVRLSLPWHGVASWDDMHAYVVAAIMDNTVPNAFRGRGGKTDQELAESLARGILLSLCHRLGVEPVGAFTYHLPDDEREAEEAEIHGQ